MFVHCEYFFFFLILFKATHTHRKRPSPARTTNLTEFRIHFSLESVLNQLRAPALNSDECAKRCICIEPSAPEKVPKTREATEYISSVTCYDGQNERHEDYDISFLHVAGPAWAGDAILSRILRGYLSPRRTPYRTRQRCNFERNLTRGVFTTPCDVALCNYCYVGQEIVR